MHETTDIDRLIETYDIENDDVIKNEFYPIFTRLWNDIEHYADNVNEYGAVMSHHLQRTSSIGAQFIVDILGFSEKAGQNFYEANLLHDLGKTHRNYDPAIWQTPHRPTAEEREEKREHTRLGVELIDLFLLKSSEKLQTHPHIRVMQSLQQHHHERVDGTGYEGLKARDQGKIIKTICIIDAYDGDMIHRSHQPSQRTPEEALKRLKSGEKYQGAFDAEILEQFIDFTLGSR